MASIKKRGPYQYQALIRRKGYPHQNRTFETKREAQAWAAVVESEMVRGVFISRTSLDKITFGQAIQKYAKEVTTNKRGEMNELRRIKVLLKHPLALRSLASLSVRDFCIYRDERAQTVSPSTIQKDLALISHLFNIARKEWELPIHNFINDISKPKIPEGRNRRLLPEEEVYIIQACEDSKAEAMTTITKLAIETAMRRGEILTLQWMHVDLAKQTVFLPSTKNGTARKVPLSKKGVSLLASWPKSIDGRVFHQYSNVSSFQQPWSRVMKRAKKAYLADCLENKMVPSPTFLVDFKFHDIRHEATTRLAEKLPNILELASVTGHKTIQMLRRYYHPRAEETALKLG